MPNRNSQQILDREFLEIRGKILELAASRDRIDRATGDADDRMNEIAKGIEILLDDEPEKAKRVQLLFSREYSDGWRSEFGI